MRRLMCAAASCFALWAPASAQAGVYTDDLSKCLVASSTLADQKVFILWMFSALGSHPDVKAYMNMTDAQHASINQNTGHLFERLVTSDCRKEGVAALKYEGNSAMEGAFSMFGQVATRGLMTDPEVTRSLSGMAQTIDMQKINLMLKEAGMTPPPEPKK
jgi:hypothetical protein